MRETVDWFNAHLPAPDEVEDRAIFWFKGDAAEMTRRVWDLAGLLDLHGVPVELLRTERPGYVVYEDAFQVAAVPFRDTFRP